MDIPGELNNMCIRCEIFMCDTTSKYCGSCHDIDLGYVVEYRRALRQRYADAINRDHKSEDDRNLIELVRSGQIEL